MFFHTQNNLQCKLHETGFQGMSEKKIVHAEVNSMGRLWYWPQFDVNYSFMFSIGCWCLIIDTVHGKCNRQFCGIFFIVAIY